MKDWRLNFGVLFASQVLAQLSSAVAQFAIIWWVTKKTGSGTMLSVMTLTVLLPQILLGPFMGVLIDRYNRKLGLIVTNAIIAVLSFALVVPFLNGKESYYIIVPLMLVISMCTAYISPCIIAVTTLMVPEKHLIRVQGLYNLRDGAVNLAGPALGGLVVYLLPMSATMAIAAAVYGLAVILIFPITIENEAKNGNSGPSGFWKDFAFGFNYLFNNKPILAIVIMFMFINFLALPAGAIITLLVTNYFDGGVWQLSVIQTTMGIAAIVGSVVLGVWGGLRRKMHTTIIGNIIMGIGIFMMGVCPVNLFIIAIVGNAIYGFTQPFTTGPLIALLQVKIEKDIQGRIFSVMVFLASIMAPVGMMVAGPLADVVGVQYIYIGIGALIAVLSAMCMFIPILHKIENGNETDTNYDMFAESKRAQA